MQEPSRPDALSIKPGTEEPEAASLLVLDAVIIAYRLALALALPPFAGDALGPIGAAYPMRQATPAEEDRRVIRDWRDRLDRLRPWQEPDGPRACFLPRRLGASGENRRETLGPFGYMAITRHEAADRLRPEPAREAIDQRRKLCLARAVPSDPFRRQD